MMKIPFVAAALAASFCVPATAGETVPAGAVELVPAAGEYVVLMSEKTAARADWMATAEKFLRRYDGRLVIWRGNALESAREALREANPRYVAVVAAPEEIDRVFVSDLHRISREMNDDVYGDFLWGIITGADAETAGTLLAKDEPLLIQRALCTTNFDRDRFRKAFFITDWGPREYMTTEDFVSSEKLAPPPEAEMTDIFAEQWEKVRPQFLMSASHATEFNLEMPYGEGLIISAGTDFYLVPKALVGEFSEALRDLEAVRAFPQKHALKKLPKTPDDKIWIAAGNCLFGDVLRTPLSMAATAISAANVKQLVGYTIPTWFGEPGWGTSRNFFNGHQTTSVGQAWFFANQTLLKDLPANAVRVPVPMTAEGLRGRTVEETVETMVEHGIELTRENLGRLYDRDAVAFYGDPLYRAAFDPEAPSGPPWDCRAGTSADGSAQVFTIKPARGNAHKGDFCLWFPRRADLSVPPKIEGTGKIPRPDILTENFVVFRALELGADETLTLTVPVK